MKRSRSFSATSVVIIGAGRVGQTLGRLLSDRGYSIEAVACRTSSHSVAARRFTRAKRSFTRITSGLVVSADVIFLTTPDSVLEKMAERLSRLRVDWKGKIVFHSSGALSSNELASLRRQGAFVASLHPLQTFPSPTEGIKRAAGIFYTFEGEAGAKKVARKMVDDLNGRFVEIAPSHKSLYHCAGTFACGGLLAPLSVAYELYGKLGIDDNTARAMLRPMVDATLEIAQKRDLPQTITGPISRGDFFTMAKHIEALNQKTPQFVALYKMLSLRLLELVLARIGPAKAKSIRSLLNTSSPELRTRRK